MVKAFFGPRLAMPYHFCRRSHRPLLWCYRSRRSGHRFLLQAFDDELSVVVLTLGIQCL
jgi:hypothetical protein